MIANFEHIYYSSFLLYLDNTILSKGQSFQNYTGFFYPITSQMQGQTTYSCGFRQIVNDTSIPNAIVMSGVYINNNFVTIGQSGLASINHSLGNINFTGVQFPQNTTIYGAFAIKDFNISITDEQEYDILFNTKFQTNPMYGQKITGLDINTLVEPAILLKLQESEYKPFAFTRVDDNHLRIRMTIITDNEYQRVGLMGIIKDLKLTTFPIVSQTPFDYMGNYTGIPYNYTQLTPISGGYQPWILESKIVQLPKRPFIEMSKKVANKICFGDVDISVIMVH